MLLGLGPLGVMRGERERPPLRVAYWLVVAIYMIATLGHVTAAGNEMVVATAISFPVGLVMFPCLLAEGLSVATETIVDQVWEGEHSEDSIAASVDRWTEDFMQDFRQQHAVDRRGSRCIYIFHARAYFVPHFPSLCHTTAIWRNGDQMMAFS